MKKFTHKNHTSKRPVVDTTRRSFLIASALLLTGCGSRRVTSSLPSPIWPNTPVNLDPSVASVVLPESTNSIGTFPGAISRSTWAKGDPITRNMDRMLPFRYITIHHDGMTAFTNTSKSSAASRLETIRKSHLRRDGGRWGDIGYHFAIDPAGRLWEGRSLQWQGAHVKAKNEGNIGIVVLGNYDRQPLNRAQSAAIESTIRILMERFDVPVSRVRTHQEWAPTICPGRSLQHFMMGLRSTFLNNV